MTTKCGIYNIHWFRITLKHGGYFHDLNDADLLKFIGSVRFRIIIGQQYIWCRRNSERG